MIWLLSALGWLITALKALLGLVVQYPLQCALAASLAACAWLYMGKQKVIGKARELEQAIVTEVTNHRATKDNYAKAQIEAARKVQAEKARIETTWKEKANEAQTRATGSIAAARAELVRWQANRKPVGRPSGGTCAGETATIAADAGGQDRMSLVDNSDLRICADNTMKAIGLQALYRDVQGVE